MPGRRVRFSTLLWPQFYSPLKIFLLGLAALFGTALIASSTFLATQPDESIYTRAAERARSALQLKLAGIDSWRWRQSFACRQMPGDCLKVLLRFGEAGIAEGEHRIALEPPTACAICHANEMLDKPRVFAVFPDLRPLKVVFWPAMTALILCLTVCGIAFYFFLQTRRLGRAAGSCVAALKISPGAPAAAQKWLASLQRSPFSASYVEREGTRIRWITEPHKFARWLERERPALNKFQTHLHLVAVHGDSKQTAALPIEMLRIVYRFLAMPDAAPVLIDEKLFTNKEEKLISMRRLVAKNKSGASLRFVVWESA